MPVVPSPSVPSVAPVANTGVGYQNANGATPDAFGASIGAAETGLGHQVEATGDMLVKHALKMQEDVNVTSAENLFLDKDIKLSKLTEQFNSLQGAARVNALPKFHEDAAAIRAEGLEQSPNGDVKKKFDQLFTRQLGFSIKAAGRESASAFRQSQNETSASVVSNSMNNIAKNAQDDQQFLAATQNALESQRALPKYQGASEETKLELDRTVVNSAWTTRLQAMATTEPLRARELFNKNIESLDGESRLKLKPIIDQRIIQKETKVASDSIIAEVGTGAMEERVKRLEGYREKPYADFKQTSSGYGTKAQPGDENIPPEQRQAVYTQRLRNELSSAYQIVDNFAPGLPKGARDALADLTYNAGATWTQSGLGQAIRAGDMETAKERLAQYTKAGGVDQPALIARRQEELKWWNTDTGSAVDTASMTAKALDKAKERSIAVFPDDPQNQAAYLDTLQSRIVADTRIMQNAARDAQLQTRNVVMNELIDEKKNITSPDQLSSQAREAYFSAPQGLRGIFDARMRKNVSADVPPSNAGTKRFSELQGMSTLRPDEFQDINIDNEPLLTRGQKSALLKTQVDHTELVKRGVRVDSAMKTMHPYLTDADIADSNNDPIKRGRYERYRGAFEAAINAEMSDKKRELYPKEKEEIGLRLLKEEVLDPGSHIAGLIHIPFTGTTKRAYELEVRKDSAAADYALIPSGSQFKHYDGTYRIKP